ELENLALNARWSAPGLDLSSSGRLYGGSLEVQAQLNTASRELTFSAASDFEPHRIENLLTTNSRRWLASYTWKQPPHVEAKGRLPLPDWQERQVDWAREVLPAFSVSGQFQVGEGA